MIISEYPNYEADNAGKLLVGKASEFLVSVLKANGLNSIYFTTAVKCIVPYGDKLTKEHLKACRPHLDKEFERVKSKYVLLLGNTALTTIGKSGITKYRGQEIEKDGRIFFATYHPAAVLRNPKNEIVFKQDIAYFANLVKGKDTNPDYDVQFVNNIDDFKQMCKEVDRSKMIAYDIETESFDHIGGRMWLMGVAVSPIRAWILPLQHEESTFTTAWKKLLAYLVDVMMRKPKWRVAQHGKFDNKWIKYKIGKPIKMTWDTMLASHLLDENTPHGLEYLSQAMLGLKPYKGKIVFKDKYTKGKLVEKVSSLKDMGLYCGEDCCNTFRIAEMQIPQVKDDVRLWNLYKRLILPASHLLEDIELRGLYLDRERLIVREAECRAKLEEVERKLNSLVPDTYPRPKKEYKKPPKKYDNYYEQDGKYIVELPINFSSPKQIGELLFGEHGFDCDPISFTDSGAPSTGEEDLIYLQDNAPEHAKEFIDTLLEYRGLSKQHSTYLLSWIEKTVEQDRDRLYPTFKQLTVTGRLSAENPNPQQIPRDKFIRSVVSAPPGYKLIEADYSQVELRIAAYIAGEPRMLRAYQLGEDLHKLTASLATGVALSEVTKEQRQLAKAINFGLIYGMSTNGFQTYAKTGYGVDLTLQEAEEFRAKYFKAYKALPVWHKRQKEIATKLGYIRMPHGRIRRLPDIRSTDKGVRGEAERQSINSPVQGFASDINLYSAVRLNKMLPESEVQIVLLVHDAIYFYIKEDCIDKYIPIIKKTMEDADAVKDAFGVDLSVPLVVDVKVGTHWGELKEI